MDRSTRPGSACVLAAALALTAACGVRTADDALPPPPPGTWRAVAAEHVALWYHGLAYLDGAPASSESDDRPTLPRYRRDYVERTTAAKRAGGAYPSPLDRQAAEFRTRFESAAAFRALEFLPLQFEDRAALFSAIRAWVRADGDPRRVPAGEARDVVAFLSSLFPRNEQRRSVGEWVALLEEEMEAFYAAHWRAVEPELRAGAAEVNAELAAVTRAIANYLAYTQLRGGHMFLVPALGTEGRLVTHGVRVPRMALAFPPETDSRYLSFRFVYEVTHPLASDAVHEYVAPAAIRQTGREALTARAAARAGALLLERTLPDRADAYRRYLLAAVDAPGRHGPAPGSAFEQAFPLPSELERGLRRAVDRALAGI